MTQRADDQVPALMVKQAEAPQGNSGKPPRPAIPRNVILGPTRTIVYGGGR